MHLGIVCICIMSLDQDTGASIMHSSIFGIKDYKNDETMHEQGLNDIITETNKSRCECIQTIYNDYWMYQ